MQEQHFTTEQMADIAGTLLAMTMRMQIERTVKASTDLSPSTSAIGGILIAKLEMLGFDRKSGMAFIRRATDISKALL
jgi:hypothetical protein